MAEHHLQKARSAIENIMRNPSGDRRDQAMINALAAMFDTLLAQHQEIEHLRSQLDRQAGSASQSDPGSTGVKEPG